MTWFLLFCLLCCPLELGAAEKVGPQGRTVLAMGTRLSLELDGLDRPHLLTASEALLSEVERIEAATSTWRPASLWSRLNAAGGQPVALANEWLQLLALAQSCSQATGGAFDPVLGALLRTWPSHAQAPTAQGLAQARAASGSALLSLDAKAGTARLLHPGAGVDGGAFVKGYALDAARRVAEAQGIRNGLLDFGGQLLVWGRPRTVEVAQPGLRQRARLRLTLTGASLSSSGCSERGQHLLDPRNGQPAPDWGAVAVVAPLALDADMLSTALFVLGSGQGLAWAEQRGLAAAFLPHTGPVRMTAAFTALNPIVLP